MNYCNPRGFKDEVKIMKDRGRDTFFTWFDGGGDTNGAFKKAEGIFERLMLPWATRFLGNLDGKTSLDIGYGSGCQVLAASQHFKYSTGIDVHEEIGFVEKELRKRKAIQNRNFALFIGQGDSIPMDDNKIDFVHSWVTFLHLGTMEVVENYLKEMFRVMNEGAIAVIFFTRLCRTGTAQSLAEYEADIKLEEQHPTGYREGGPLTRVNRANLILSRWKMIELVLTMGFKYLAPTFSYDETDVLEKDKIHGQHGIVFQKPVVATTTLPPKRKKKLTIRKKQSKKRKKEKCLNYLL